MPHTCVINKCTYNKKKSDPRKPTGVSIHRFPSDPVLKKLWVEFVTIQNNKQYNHRPHHVLCSQHFAADSFIDGSLKFRSVPTEFHIRYDTSEDGWCDKPELVFGLNKTAQTSKGVILNLQHGQSHPLLDDETLMDDPTMFVREHDDPLSIENVGNSDLIQESVKTSETNDLTNKIQQLNQNNDPSVSVWDEDNTLVDINVDHNYCIHDFIRIGGSLGHSSSSTDVSMPDAVTKKKLKRLSSQSEIYTPEEVASRMTDKGRKRYINDFTESDFDTRSKRARNLQYIKNLMQEKQQKLNNARKKASRWKKRAASLQDVVQKLKEKVLLSEKAQEDPQIIESQ